MLARKKLHYKFSEEQRATHSAHTLLPSLAIYTEIEKKRKKKRKGKEIKKDG